MVISIGLKILKNMIEIEITINKVPEIPRMVFPDPSQVPIHILHLANEGLVHIDFEDLDVLGQEMEETVCMSI